MLRISAVWSLLLLLAASAQAQLEPPAGPKPLAKFTLPDWGMSVAFAPEGKSLAVGTYQKVLLIDVAERKVTGEIPVRGGYVRGVAWSPDGRQLATGCFQAVEVWNVADRENRLTLKIRGYANDVAFTPDGSQLLAAGEDGQVRRWAATDGTELEPLKGSTDPLQGLAISNDGRLLAVAAGDDTRLTRAGSVKVWTLADGQPAATIVVPPEKAATRAAFSPDGATLYVSDLNKRVTLYDMATGDAKSFFGKHSRQVNDIHLTRDGATAVSCGGGQQKDGNEILVWKTADGDELVNFSPHAAKVARIALSADESLLASVSLDKTAYLWDFTAMLKSSSPSGAVESRAEPPQVAAPVVSLGTAVAFAGEEAAAVKVLRVGIIGLDTSHATAFTKIINEAKEGPLAGLKVVAAYPQGSLDIPSSTERVPGYTEEVKKHGVEIVDSIEALLEKVDCVLLETNDGRPHLDQALPVLKAKKPVFVDKPLAGSLADCVAIYEAARHYGTPVFSSSSLRFTKGAQAARNGSVGKVFGCDAYSPCYLEATHPDLYWYGIHGVESLFTVMGAGCEKVSRTSTADFDIAVGAWADGRVGTFRGIRKGASGYGGTVFGEKSAAPLGDYGGYEPLVVEIAKFFQSGQPPVSEEETLEIYAFMSAADVSKHRNGEAVTLESVMTAAREAARKSLEGRLQ